MRYINEEIGVVINSHSGQCTALEHLGFKTEGDMGVKNMGVKKAIVKKEKNIVAGGEHMKVGAAVSRSGLMEVAKARGIKNFRVMNKVELVEVVELDANSPRVLEIQKAAVARWKAGWTKK